MQKIRIMDVEGTEFPAGRRTRVLLGENGAINGDHFCQGYVVIYPGGSIPLHEHTTVESYTILQGHGMVTVGEESAPIEAGEMVYMSSGQKHGLRNTSDGDMHMMFAYAPKMIVEHWAQEQSGELK